MSVIAQPSIISDTAHAQFAEGYPGGFVLSCLFHGRLRQTRLSVCLCVDAYSGTRRPISDERLQKYASLKSKRAIFLKRLRSRDML